VEIGRQISCCVLDGIDLPLSGYTGSSRWQLNLKTAKVTSLSPGRVNLANKRATATTKMLTRKYFDKAKLRNVLYIHSKTRLRQVEKMLKHLGAKLR